MNYSKHLCWYLNLLLDFDIVLPETDIIPGGECLFSCSRMHNAGL